MVSLPGTGAACTVQGTVAGRLESSRRVVDFRLYDTEAMCDEYLC